MTLTFDFFLNMCVLNRIDWFKEYRNSNPSPDFCVARLFFWF